MLKCSEVPVPSAHGTRTCFCGVLKRAGAHHPLYQQGGGLQSPEERGLFLEPGAEPMLLTPSKEGRCARVALVAQHVLVLVCLGKGSWCW